VASLNKIMIIGNVGRDPELRMTATGKPVASFSVAVNRVGTAPEGGERREETEWFNIVCWQRLAELSQQLITKGRLIFVEGRLQTRKWEDREGQQRTSVEIIANDFQLLDPRRDREPAMAAAPQQAEAGSFDPDEIPF
jgi:single-strand DNA-binding protein